MRAIASELILSIAFGAAAFAQTADLAVTNSRVYTVNPKQPRASAIAVRDGRILAVGDDVSRYIGPATEVIDAKGGVIVPGFIDSHGHVRGLGDMLDSLDLRGAASESAVAEKVREQVKRHKPGEWIRGSAWDQNLWVGRQFPDAAGISKAAPDNPVALDRVDGHALWVNRKAMEIADIGAATPDPPGGRILRDAHGAPTGVLLDQARELVSRKIPGPSREQVEQSLLRATRLLARDGITTVHDAGVQYADIEGYRSLIRRGQLPIRIYAMILYPLPLPDKPEIGDYLTVRSLKIIADGALGSRGAAMIEPYADDPGNRGLLILDRATIRAAAEKALAKGFQVNTHAIGDRANRTVLEAYADVLKGGNDKRFRIEHAQVVAPEDFAKFAKVFDHRLDAAHPRHQRYVVGAGTAWGRRESKAPMRGRRFCTWVCTCRTAPISRWKNPNPLLGFLRRRESAQSGTVHRPAAGFRINACPAKRRCGAGPSKALTPLSKRAAKVRSSPARWPISRCSPAIS